MSYGAKIGGVVGTVMVLGAMNEVVKHPLVKKKKRRKKKR